MVPLLTYEVMEVRNFAWKTVEKLPASELVELRGQIVPLLKNGNEKTFGFMPYDSLAAWSSQRI